MITLISASNKGLDSILIESASKLSYVDEIIIMHESPQERIVESGIVKMVYTSVPFEPTWVYAHATLLHKGLDIAKNDLVMFCDDDVFFMEDVTKIYLDYMDKFNIQMIGVSHYRAFPALDSMDQAFGFFPTVINMLIDKKNLPYKGWMADHIKVRRWITPELDWDDPDLPSAPDYYLLAGPIPGYTQRFYKPNGIYDVGCNLYLWVQDAGLNYLAFGQSPANRHIHHETVLYGNGDYYPIGTRNLLYHRTNLNPPDGSWPKLEDYIGVYNDFKSTRKL